MRPGVLRPPVSSAIREIANAYGVSKESLFREQRGKMNEAKQAAIYLIRELCDKSLKEMAQSVGWACSVIKRQIKVGRKLHHRIEQIREMASSTSIQKKA